MNLVVDTEGAIRCLYSETIDLAMLGDLTICRASHVEPDENGQWWSDLKIIGGPRLGPYARKSEALAAEIAWIEKILFTIKN